MFLPRESALLVISVFFLLSKHARLHYCTVPMSARERDLLSTEVALNLIKARATTRMDRRFQHLLERSDYDTGHRQPAQRVHLSANIKASTLEP